MYNLRIFFFHRYDIRKYSRRSRDKASTYHKWDTLSPDEAKILLSIQKAQETSSDFNSIFHHYGITKVLSFVKISDKILVVSPVNNTLVVGSAYYDLPFRIFLRSDYRSGPRRGISSCFGRTTSLITPILYLVVLGLCLKIRARKYEGNRPPKFSP